MMNSESDVAGKTSLTDPVVRESSRIPILIAIICGLIAVVAIIIAAVALGRGQASPTVVNSGGGQPQSSSQSSAKTQSGTGSQSKVWTIAIGHDYGAHEYIDTKGYLAGFHHDLIDAVCKAAGIICKTMWQPYVNCWDSSAGKRATAGEGLMARWFDACTGWTATVDRVQVVSFSDPFLKISNSLFFVKKGQESQFNPRNLIGLTKPIGFLDGWASDEKCLARDTSITGSTLPVNKILHIATTVEMKNKIVNGDIAAGYTSVKDLEHYSELAPVGIPFSCKISGNGMMTRKDNDFNTHWNRGFAKIKATGYRKLCSDAKTKHGSKGVVNCVS